MLKGNTSKTDGFFQNQAEFFKDFKAKTIVSKDIKLTDFSGLKVAVIGTDQHTVSNLEYIVQNAEFVKVFQISPVFILPQTEKGIQKLISHPLIIKNRRLFNHRIKSMLAIRYLDAQVQEQWLKRQLMPNCATKNKLFLKSDSYYAALQRDTIQLITWPVVKITENAIQSMENIEHFVDVIITTY